jgi:hypothetical protein
MKQSFATNNQLFGTGAHLWEKEGLSLSYIQGFQLFGIIRGGGGGPLGRATKCTYSERTPKTIQETYKKHKKSVSREALLMDVSVGNVVVTI